MITKIVLLSKKYKEINRFLSEFYDTNMNLEDSLYWKKSFSNPIDMSELIAAFIDNISSFELTMWISLDEDIFIKISSSNAENVIKYLFERYPY